MGDDLRRDLFYLTSGPPDAAGVVVVAGAGGRWAPLFSARSDASAAAAAAPDAVRVARAPAGDPRAREALLLACLDNGAEVLALDPDPRAMAGGVAPRRAGSVRFALAAVRSHRTAGACL